MAFDIRPKESSLTSFLAEQVQQRRGAAWKLESTEGDPDWGIFLPGGHFGVLELKRRGEKPRANQLARLEELRAMGCYAGWTDSKAGVTAFLDGLQQRRPFL